jgi:hypothetical protein
MWRTIDVIVCCLVEAATLRAGAIIPTPPLGMMETSLFLKETKKISAALFRKRQGRGQNQLRFAMTL